MPALLISVIAAAVVASVTPAQSAVRTRVLKPSCALSSAVARTRVLTALCAGVTEAATAAAITEMSSAGVQIA